MLHLLHRAISSVTNSLQNYFSPLDPYILGTGGKVSRVGLHVITVLISIAFMPHPVPFILGTFIGYIAPESIMTALSRLNTTIERAHIGFIAPLLAIGLVFRETILAMASFYIGGYITSQISKIILERKELVS